MGNSSSGHVCHSPQHTSSPVYVPNSRTSSTCNRCSATRLADEVNVHVSTVSPAQQSHSETMDHIGGRSDINSPHWPSQPWFPHLLNSVLLGPTVTAGVCLGWQVMPYACMEALMQHYQAAAFSKDVSSLAAVPRRPSTCMTTGGFASLTRAQDKQLICLVPQLLNHYSLLSLRY